jgi:hypothetical protein
VAEIKTYEKANYFYHENRYCCYLTVADLQKINQTMKARQVMRVFYEHQIL